jgi:hypothetical protein
MKLLYLSCHSVLEYDEVKLFTELGIDVFSHGAYTNPKATGDPKRPPIDAPFHQDLYNMAVAYGKENLHPDMIAWADVIVVMHIVDWLSKNWEKMKGKRVIWRSIGQSTLYVERMLAPLRAQGLEIVRYSPRERTIPGFVGEDAIIRFYKDPDEFKGWTGEEKQVLTVGQAMKKRDPFCNFSIFEEATRGWPRKVIGPENEDVGDIWGGCLDYEALKAILRSSRAYFYTGTYPASYTLNFIEAWMTGCPIVALGPKLGNSPFELGQNTYEVPDLFKDTEGGLFADDIETLRKYIKILMEDSAYASELSEKGRQGAIKYFGKEKIKEEWRRFLNV